MPSRQASLPTGLSPRYLSRAEVAAYVGVSPDTFDEEVRAGQWPPARRRGSKGARITWDRFLIDLFADRHSGLGGPSSASGSADPTPTVDDLVQAAAEDAAIAGVRNAPPRHRPKHRKQDAA